MEQAASRYQRDLAVRTDVQGYLASRGIDQATALSYRLGVVDSPIVGHERVRGRLAIPYLTHSGVVNFSFRCLKPHLCKLEECPKYLPITGMGRNLYNVNAIHTESPFICVTEGELDAITLTMSGIPAVGIPGASNWQKHWSKCLEDFEEIFVFGDGDKAGRDFANFLSTEVKARPVALPQGEDVNDVYRRSGAAGLRALIE